jgi:endonuclease YncB( thermonuclease family)
MRTRIAVLVILAITTSFNQPAYATSDAQIRSVYDGDTVTLVTGEKIRLLQIDTPELSPSECYGKEARLALIKMLGQAGKLSLKKDPGLDSVDRYGRLLRYVFKGNTNINLKMVEVGAATPYFYRSERGAYSKSLLKGAQNAQRKNLGLWSKCPGTTLTPEVALTTNTPKVSSPGNSSTSCNPNYKGCIPNSSQDLDCADIKRLGRAPVEVIGTDVYKLDRDGDGIACTS